MATSDILERHYPGTRAALKRDILANALLCFNEHGLEPTTIEMIKDSCATSVGNIYHHFGNKDGLIATLFFCALDDQSRLLGSYLERASCAQEGIAALVFSYVDWVAEHADMARFQFQARASVAKGPRAEELAIKNRERNRHLLKWLTDHSDHKQISPHSAELLPSLIIGPSENYCRAWLAGRVKTNPFKYREALAKAAWLSVTG